LENINRKKNEKHFHQHPSGQRGSPSQIFISQQLTWRVRIMYVLLYVVVAALKRSASGNKSAYGSAR
jgi:hypothetical protein